MSKCITGRTAVIALRKPGRPPRETTVGFPASWKRSTLLRYVRSEHSGETVRILSWHRVAPPGSWEPSLWLVNPESFADYRTGALVADTTAVEPELPNKGDLVRVGGAEQQVGE